MGFIEKEKLYKVGEVIVNGTKVFKYADIILGCENTYHHLVFIKRKNFFMILMNDYNTFPTFEMVSESLKLLCETELSGPNNDKIDKTKIKTILSKLNKEQNYYSEGNYIIRTQKEKIPGNKKEFFLDGFIPITEFSACISNMDTLLNITICRENKCKIDGYDKLSGVYADDELLFGKLLCLKARPERDAIHLQLVSEHSYSMSHSILGGGKINGDIIWSLQVMDYLINADRDDPIDIRIENNSIYTGKKRFFFIFSIRGLRLKNDVRFGLVTFTNESGICIEREKDYTETLTENYDCYAQIAVVNDSLRLAAKEATDMIYKAVSLLHVVLLDDSPHTFFDTIEAYKSWDIREISPALYLNEIFYVENVIDSQQYAILSRKNITNVQPFILDDEIEELLNKENILEDFFYLTKNKHAENLYQAIVWLNSSINTQDKKVKIISLYNCVEFLVSGEKGKSLKKELELTYGSEFENSFSAISQVTDEIQNEEIKGRIKGAIASSFEGNPSVKSKLETLVARIPIALDSDDWLIFDKLKQNRQMLIHNKKNVMPITDQEMKKLFHLFSKLIIYKILDLSCEVLND